MYNNNWHQEGKVSLCLLDYSRHWGIGYELEKAKYLLTYEQKYQVTYDRFACSKHTFSGGVR